MPPLGASPHASLQAIGAKLAPLVAAGVPAMQEMAATKQARVTFYESGARYALVQKMNGARKLAYGKVGEIVHDQPQLGLPVTFPDTFFLHDTRKRRKETPATIDAELTALKEKIGALEIKRAKVAAILAAEEAASAKKQSAKTAKEIAKAEKAQADASAKLAALKGNGG